MVIQQLCGADAVGGEETKTECNSDSDVNYNDVSKQILYTYVKIKKT